LYNPSDIVDSFAADPLQVWVSLDSFWRTRVVTHDADLVKYQTLASLLLAANTYSRSQHFINAQGIRTLEPFAQVPWYPIILYRSQLVSLTYLMYGGPYVYDDPPVVNYGDAGTPLFRSVIQPSFAEITTLYDSITHTTTVFDGGSFTFDAATKTLTFQQDPFLLLPSRTTSSGDEYLILWARNAKLDLLVPQEWTGWILQMGGVSSADYVRAQQAAWKAVVGGATIAQIKSGVTVSRGLPVAEEGGVVDDILSDGYHTIVSIEGSTKLAPATAMAAVQIGDRVVTGQPLTEGVKVLSGLEVAASSPGDVPGIAFEVPSASGCVLRLFAPNASLAWSYASGRASPWRFPLGGTVTDVETYWEERDVDLSAYYPGLVDGCAVNPMQLLSSDILKNAITVAAVDLTLGEQVTGFIDRVALSIGSSSYMIVQQKVADIVDGVVDTSAWSENVGYGIPPPEPTDIVSVSGPGLVLADYTPQVTVS
jgi:hypothetical protein